MRLVVLVEVARVAMDAGLKPGESQMLPWPGCAGQMVVKRVKRTGWAWCEVCRLRVLMVFSKGDDNGRSSIFY